MKAHRKQLGYSLASAALATVLGAAALHQSLPIISRWASSPVVNNAAQHATWIHDAFARYVHDNDAVLKASTSLNASTQVSFQSLRDAGYLPASVSNLNAYGQSYVLRVRHVVRGVGASSKNVLEPLIVTAGGQSITEDQLRRLAAAVPAGGVITSNQPTIAMGTQGGWSVPVSQFGVNPGAGHLAMALFYNQAAQDNDALRRNLHAGQPELNRMNTSIDMNNQSIANASTVAAQAVSLANPSGGNVGGFRMADNATMVALNDKNISTAGVVAAGTASAGALHLRTPGGGVGGWAMSDENWMVALNNKHISTGGLVHASEVHGTHLVSNGRLYAREYMEVGGVANEGWACGPNGVVGRTGEGALLSCVNGVWRQPGSSLIVNGSSCPGGYSPVAYYVRGHSAPGFDHSQWRWQAHDFKQICNNGGSGNSGDKSCWVLQIEPSNISQVKCVM